MGNNNLSEDNENDKVTSVELLQHNRRLLYFSDGTLEESFDIETEGNIDTVDKAINSNINENEMAFMPHLKRKISKVSSNILAGIDYVGGGLATLFGITTPKYASEIENYKHPVPTADTDANIEENGNSIWRQVESGSSNNKITPNELIVNDMKPGSWLQNMH